MMDMKTQPSWLFFALSAKGPWTMSPRQLLHFPNQAIQLTDQNNSRDLETAVAVHSWVWGRGGWPLETYIWNQSMQLAWWTRWYSEKHWHQVNANQVKIETKDTLWRGLEGLIRPILCSLHRNTVDTKFSSHHQLTAKCLHDRPLTLNRHSMNSLGYQIRYTFHSAVLFHKIRELRAYAPQCDESRWEIWKPIIVA